MRRLPLVLVVIVLGACSTLGLRAPVAENDLGRVDRVAVASVMGERYHGILVGLTSFGNQYFAADTTDWDIDALAVDTALAKLAPHYAGRVAALDLQGERGESFHRQGDYRYIDRARLLAMASAQGFDTLLLIHPAADANQPDRAGGVGYQAAFGIGGVSGCSYAQFIVEVLRVADGRQLGWDWARDCDNTADPGWQPGLEHYTPEQRAALRALTEAQVRQQVQQRLDWLGLVGQPAGARATADERPPGLFRRD